MATIMQQLLYTTIGGAGRSSGPSGPFQGIPTGFSFSIATEEPSVDGVATDGNDYYVVGQGTDRVYKYNSAGVYSGVSFPVTAEDTSPRGLCYANGKLYMTGNNSKKVFEYTLAGVYTGFNFDLTVASGADITEGIVFDGQFFWTVTTSNDRVFKFGVDGIYQNEFYSLSGIEGDSHDITYDGTFYYVIGYQKGISQFDAAWNYIQSFTTGLSLEKGACWNPTTNKMLIADNNTDAVYEYA
jgi:hypothetical protein